MTSPAYLFEELSEDLPRPPLAAFRALLAAGIVVAPRGWRKLPEGRRRDLARLGLSAIIDPEDVRRAITGIPLPDLKLVSPHVEPPDGGSLPPTVERAAAAVHPLSHTEWRALRPIDRFVLGTLAPNARLFGRALEEILRRRGITTTWSTATPIYLAHVELQLGRAMERLWDPSFLEGRGLVLARAAGLRAARASSDLYDLHADDGIGLVELAASPQPDRGVLLWQAHASRWDGSFSIAASLSAATTAAVCVLDMLHEIQPAGLLTAGMIRHEPWEASPMFQDEATVIWQP